MAASNEDAWTIGVLFSRTGLMEIPSAQHVRGVTLAIDEINASGGILGRPLAAIHYDTCSDPALYRKFADRLLTDDSVSVIVGCCTSLSRKAVLPSIERRNGLLWYPDLYEGFEYSPNVIYVGAATNQNSLPLARYLFGRGARRFLLIGSDYIYPREANRVMRDLVERHGGEVLDEIYLPLQTESKELDHLVSRVLELRPDVVFSTLVGSNICSFCERYADAGIDPAEIPIASHNVTEAELLEVGRTECAGHITAAPYFSSIASDANRNFVDAFRRRFGEAAPVSQYASAAYAAVRLFALSLERAGEMDTQRMMMCARGLEMRAPHGRIVIDEDNNHTWLTPRVGVWNGADEFDLVWESEQMVQPDPWLVSYGGVEDVPEAAQAPG
ncbi:MAG TPA: transporter substrate-binding domain-containing protein [Burkholderiales bacterium]|nr:transporter substrate-binding domain-containing protein [Burkholderiales bacterium]